MMWNAPLGRRKSSVSSSPPAARDSPPRPIFASALAESPVIAGLGALAESHYPSALSQEVERPQSPGAGPSSSAGQRDQTVPTMVPFPKGPGSASPGAVAGSPEMSPADKDKKETRRRSRSRKWSSISVLRGKELERVDETGPPFFGRRGSQPGPAQAGTTEAGAGPSETVVRDYASVPLTQEPDSIRLDSNRSPTESTPFGQGYGLGAGGREREFRLMPDPMSETQDRVRPSTIDTAQLSPSPAPAGGMVSSTPRLAIDPSLLPPASAHDAYLSRIIRPLDERLTAPTQPPSPSTPADGARPSLVRHSSAPGVAQTNALLPAFGTEDPSALGRGARQPIFQIYKAELKDGSDKIVRELRGHLEEILALQSEIGRMHLALEGLDLGTGADGINGDGNTEQLDQGASKDESQTPSAPASEKKKEGKKPGSEGAKKLEEASSGLEKREKAVNAIMAKLDKLSEGLRTYNTLGTPRLAFTHDSDRSPATPLDPSGNPITRPGQPHITSTNSIHVDAHTKPKPHSSVFGGIHTGKMDHPRFVEHRQSPLRVGFARSSTAEDGLSSSPEVPIFRRGNSAGSPPSSG